MTVTFQNGSFFHPLYGWFDKEPDFNVGKNRSGLIHEPIGEDMAISLDDLPVQFAESLKELIARFNESAQKHKALQEAGLIVPQTEPDLSSYMDKRVIGTGGYYFEYDGNTVTATVNANLSSRDPDKVNAMYQTHKQNIMDLKKVGYNDEAIKMLLAALDGKYRKAMSWANQWQSEFSKMRFMSAEHRQQYLDQLAQLDAWAEGIEQERLVNSTMFMDAWNNIEHKTNWTHPEEFWDPADTHIRNLDKIRDFSWDDSMSDIEKEARSLSVVFRVRGDQMIDYAKRYEEISGQIDAKLSNGEITDSDYERYRADLNTAFVKTYNLNIMGQAAAAGLSDEKAKELAMAFSEEYIRIREQTDPNDRNADKLANAALKSLAAQGWAGFSLYTSENRAKADINDPWYAMMDEDALYWGKLPQPYDKW